MKLEELIQDKIEAVDIEGLIADAVDRHVQIVVRNEMSNAIRDQCDAQSAGVIEKEVGRILSNPVKVSDGWDKSQTFDSFELLFKERLKKALSSGNYSLKNQVDKLIKEKIGSLVKDAQSSIATTIADQAVAQAAKSAKR